MHPVCPCIFTTVYFEPVFYILCEGNHVAIMPNRELRTMQGMSYRQSPAETLSGCRHLRCKAFLVIVLGILMVASFPATYVSALLIVGVFLILLGSALAFMYCVANDLGKDNNNVGQGVNRSWNRLRRQRLQRCRRRNSSSSGRRSTNTNATSDENEAPPPSYETSISVEQLMSCPEPSDWTFLPTEPPPEYFPPITALDTNHSSTATGDQPSIDQSELPIYSISGEMSYTLPTYEQAVDETPTARITESENVDGAISNQNTVVIEVDSQGENEPLDTELPSTSFQCETRVSHSIPLPISTAQSRSENVDIITQVLI